jgi:hypothetical protein
LFEQNVGNHLVIVLGYVMGEEDGSQDARINGAQDIQTTLGFRLNNLVVE